MQLIDIGMFFDPELILPSEDSVHELAFWVRLQEWTEDPRPRLGPKTSEGLLEMMADPPLVDGLPLSEFWKIMGKLASRTEDITGGGGLVCETHLRAAYSPILGRPDNADTLIDTLASASQESGTVLATDSRCWTDDVCQAGCDTCRSRVIDICTVPEASLSNAWRQQFLYTAADSFTMLRDAAAEMFPNLTFSDSAWNHLDTLSGEVRDIIEVLVMHLSVLNDEVAGIWSSYPVTVDRQSQLGSLGVVASPENANTRRSGTAMNVRTLSFGGLEIRCEWHTKLKPNRDRIYFAVEEGQVYVGAIIEHL